MALPPLYWLLECTVCKARRVVHDTHLEFTGEGVGHDGCLEPGEGYGDRTIAQRYGCLAGCAPDPRVIGSIWSLPDGEMTEYVSRETRELTADELGEWERLAREAGLDGPNFRRRPLHIRAAPRRRGRARARARCGARAR